MDIFLFLFLFCILLIQLAITLRLKIHQAEIDLIFEIFNKVTQLAEKEENHGKQDHAPEHPDI